jgi:hypothetical protein
MAYVLVYGCQRQIMKTFISLSTAILLIIGTLTMAAPIKSEMTSLTQESLFILKASRKYKGAEVEVISSSGYLVTTQKIAKRKFVIDFKNVRTGTYRIIVRKGSTREEFQFIKK